MHYTGDTLHTLISISTWENKVNIEFSDLFTLINAKWFSVLRVFTLNRNLKKKIWRKWNHGKGINEGKIIKQFYLRIIHNS